MWVVYDEYDESVEVLKFYSIEYAAEFIEKSIDPLTWRIRYED